MRQQSSKYSPFAAVRRCDFRATLRVENVEARDAASISTSNGDSGLNLSALSGWKSNAVSGAEGAFSSPPFIYVAFAEDIDSIGTTVSFRGGDYATSIRVTAYAADGATYISRGTFTNSGRVASMNLIANGYRYLKIEFLTAPASGKHIVLDDVVFGLLKVYDKDSIQSATIVNRAGFAGMSLPSQQLTLVVDNSGRDYDILNPQGIYKYLENDQPIEVECLIDGEAVFMGTYYFQKASTPNSSILTTITAGDKIIPLAEQKYLGVRDEVLPLETAVAEILEGTGIRAVYESGLASQPVRCSMYDGTNSCIVPLAP